MLHAIYVTFWRGNIICSVVAKERDIKRLKKKERERQRTLCAAQITE